MSPTDDELHQARDRGRREGRRYAISKPVAAAELIPAVLEDAKRAASGEQWGGANPEMAATYEGKAEGIRQGLFGASRCGVCGRELTDPSSIAAGIGPDCLARLAEDRQIDPSSAVIEWREEVGLGPKTYLGVRSGDRHETSTVTVQVPGRDRYLLTLTVPHGSAYPKSPDGHAWGYGGSGPSQLALDILTDLLGHEAHPACYQAFKDAFIATARGPHLAIHEGQIRLWLGAYEGPVLANALEPQKVGAPYEPDDVGAERRGDGR
jgi:Family of unknown function (DUF6011)